MASIPKNVVIRAYQVGFGDCLLLTFEYTDDDRRHMLIDFGTVAWGAPGNIQKKVAQSIVDETGGKLHAVVITHRHKDHISGLVGAWKLLKPLAPNVVIEPWTESPKYARDTRVRPGIRGLGMHSVHAACKLAAREAHRFSEADPRALAGIRTLAAAGDTKLATSLDNYLKEWGSPNGKKRRFVAKDDPLDLSDIIPGVNATVLGPPKSIRREGKESSEFWPLAHGALSLAGESSREQFPGAPTYAPGQEPATTRWFRRRLQQVRSDQLFEMVQLANGEVNNTSVILLLEVGDKKLLFPGDAEVEGWQEALDDVRYREKLGNVHVYKVGHHGSRNATPISLWNGFKHRGDGLHAILSSKKTEMWADVPRSSLMRKLRKETKLVSTMGKRRLFESVVVEVGN